MSLPPSHLPDLRPHLSAILALLVLWWAGVTFETQVVPLGFKFLIDDGIVSANWQRLELIIVLLAVGAVLASVAMLGRDWLRARLGAAVVNGIRLRLHEHLQRLSLRDCAEMRSVDLLSRFSGDLDAVERALTLALPFGLVSLAGIVLAAGVLFVVDWELALLAMLGIPVSLIGPRLLAGRARDAGRGEREARSDVLAAVQEEIGAPQVVKAFCLQGHLRNRFAGLVDRLQAAAARSLFLSYLMERVTRTAILFGNILVLVAGGVLAMKGRITVGDLVLFQGMFRSLSKSTSALSWIVPALLEAGERMGRIEAVLRVAPSVADAPGAPTLPRLSGAIEVRGVGFGYSRGSRTLANVSLTIPAGASVAFVGGSGSGKSTMVNLLLRFFDQDQGVIAIDGVDHRTVTQDSLRRQIGLVTQDNILFDTSILENIRLGQPAASDEEVIDAARAAKIHHAITQLPHGYDTRVGERGAHLSGGQRQRVAIARAFLAGPAILILDEATSALDPITERGINETVEGLRRGHTVISVTHRLTSVLTADCIVVFDNGKVVESGKHGELLKKKGHYAALWDQQSGFTLSEDGDLASVDVDRLRRFNIFDHLDNDMLAETARLFVTETALKDQMVIREGDRGSKFYIIVRGKVDVLRRDWDGTQHRVASLVDGGHFGEIALLRNVPRTASIRAAMPTTFLTLEQTHFMRLLAQSPHLIETMRERMEQNRK